MHMYLPHVLKMPLFALLFAELLFTALVNPADAI